MGITAGNFLWVAIYISVMNSFLEEFFFRGFGFITLKKYVNIKFYPSWFVHMAANFAINTIRFILFDVI